MLRARLEDAPQQMWLGAAAVLPRAGATARRVWNTNAALTLRVTATGRQAERDNTHLKAFGACNAQTFYREGEQAGAAGRKDVNR